MLLHINYFDYSRQKLVPIQKQRCHYALIKSVFVFNNSALSARICAWTSSLFAVPFIHDNTAKFVSISAIIFFEPSDPVHHW